MCFCDIVVLRLNEKCYSIRDRIGLLLIAVLKMDDYPVKSKENIFVVLLDCDVYIDYVLYTKETPYGDNYL
jgi:hypothetical protein